MDDRFPNRREAGAALAPHVDFSADGHEVLVLGLPRGGVPVAYEVARRLGVPLDVFVVRKLGVPGQEELAMGAIASGGARVLNEDVLALIEVDPAVIELVAAREQDELDRRERTYREGRAPLELRGRSVVLVDDGLATGATMRAAVRAARQRGAARVAVAVPVAPPETAEALRQEADAFFCLHTPPELDGVGRWYRDFRQTTDDEVRELLARYDASAQAGQA